MNIILLILALIANIQSQTVPTVVTTKSIEGVTPTTVKAIHYNVGKMEQVITNRLDVNSKHYTKGFVQRFDVEGYVAVPPCSRLGQIVKVSFQDGKSKLWGDIDRYQVVDCTKQEDLAYHYAHNIGIETDGNTALREHFYLNRGGDGWTKAKIYGFE